MERFLERYIGRTSEIQAQFLCIPGIPVYHYTSIPVLSWCFKVDTKICIYLYINVN